MNAFFPDPAQLSLFITASLLMGLTPGPDMLLVLNRSIGIGFRAGMTTMAGIVTGAFFHTLAAALGLSLLLVRYPVAYDIIRYGGALYLAFIGWQILRHGRGDGLLQAAASHRQKHRHLFRQALLTNLLNPKVALFILAFLPQFIPQGATNPTIRIMILGTIFFGTGIIIMTGLAAMGGHLRRWLSTRPALLRGQAIVTGLLMLAFALGLILSGSPAGASSGLSAPNMIYHP